MWTVDLSKIGSRASVRTINCNIKKMMMKNKMKTKKVMGRNMMKKRMKNQKHHG